MDSQRVLQLLRHKKSVVSGEEISEQLGVSRTTVWKHIRNLQSMGYAIEATPHCGYKLVSAPDRFLPEEITWGLGTKTFGQKIVYYEKTTSTNDRAMALASDGVSEGTLVISEYQTKGRGRRDRHWVSRAGKNILFSLIFRPPWVAEQGTMLTLLVATAIAQAIEELYAIQVKIKWPNDILYEGEKLAGILTEMQAQADKISFLVSGVGINSNDVPLKDLRMPATSLARIVGKPILRVPLLQTILSRIENLYKETLEQGMGLIRERWLGYSYLESKTIRVKHPSGSVFQGRVEGVSESGALRVVQDAGDVKIITSGEISILL